MEDRSDLITLLSQKSPQRPKIIRDINQPVWFRWLVSFVGFLLLLVSTWFATTLQDHFWYILLIGLFVAFQVIFPLKLLSNEADLSHVITLGGGLLYGPVVACWAFTIGVALGYGIRWFESRKWNQSSIPPAVPVLDVLTLIGVHHIAMLVALPLFGLWQVVSPIPPSSAVIWGEMGPALLLFALIYMFLYIGNTLVAGKKQYDFWRDLLYLALLKLLPLPFVLVVVMGYPALGLGALVFLGTIPVVMEVLFYGTYSIRRDLDRRSQELHTLNHISRTLRTAVDLNQLLEEVLNQVSQLFAVENFYIALYNPEEEQLWYPIAVKHFQRVNWPPRALEDRLTDRVIRERSAILLPHNARDALASVGLPAAEDSPTAWMGVPLISSERVIGCLGVFSFSPEVVFSKADVRWLTTLSGQVSVAIENMLRYQTAQRRADLALNQQVHQLTILEAVGRELAAAIRSDHLMDVILGYALEVTHSKWGSISLYEPIENLMAIKALRGYQKAIVSLSAEHGLCGRAVTTGQKIYAADVLQEPDYVDLTAGEARSQLCVPLLHESRVLGVLTLESEQVDGFSESDQAFINQLATQATVALVNAELYAQAQERISEFSAVFNSVGEGLLVLDSSGQITLANEAIRILTGLSPTEFSGQRLVDLPETILAYLGYNSEQAEALVGAMGQGQVLASPRATIRISELNSERILERTSFPVWDRRGRVTGWMIVLRNMTEEIQVTQAKDLITETLVHDLRSPASAVLGALDVLKDSLNHDQTENEIVVQAIQVARRGAQRMLGMTESLLEISRLQSGKIETNLLNFSLRPMATSVLNDFKTEALEYGIILHNDIPDDLSAVRADLNKTTRVLTNLVDNALKFTPAGGQISLSAAHLTDGFITVKVSDTGPGVPEGYREKIFERFSQVPGLVGRRRGSGLGLTFCRLAIEAQGGKIWMEPRPGGGSIFMYTLPVSRA